jgi:uncharacterized protein (DUF4415 family)
LAKSKKTANPTVVARIWIEPSTLVAYEPGGPDYQARVVAVLKKYAKEIRARSLK